MFSTAGRSCRLKGGFLQLNSTYPTQHRFFPKQLLVRHSIKSRHLASKKRKSATAIEYDTVADRLAKKSVPTLLYESRSNAAYIFGCYFIGGSLIIIAWINNFKVNNSRAAEDLPSWVPLGTAVGVAGLFGMGSYMCYRPQNIIKTIKSIPSNNPKLPPVVFQIQRSQTLPLWKPRPQTIKPSDVTMSAPLFIGGEQQLQLELDELQRRADRRRAFATDDLLAWPFRQMGYWIGLTFYSVRKAFSNSGIIQFHIRGHGFVWRMERDRAWALDDGRYIDSLVKIKEI